MSSSHILVVARNLESGAVELPLGDMTLYGCGGEEDVLQTCRARYTEEWVLTLYAPYESSWAGSRAPAHSDAVCASDTTDFDQLSSD